jgi:DNA ligase-1
MTVLKRFKELTDKLTSTLGRLEKEAFLREYERDDEVKDVLKYLFNPFIVSGISDKKLNKHRNFKELPLLSLTAPHTEPDFLKLLEYFKKNNTGRDEDVKHLVRAAGKFAPHTELVYSVIKRDLKLGIQGITLNKVYGANFVPSFDVMLAESYAENTDYVVGKEYIITEKLDGVRCVSILGADKSCAFFSRNGQPILDLTELTDEVRHLEPGFVYDGELLLNNRDNLPSEDLYRMTVRVTNADGAKKGLFFNVFDMIEKTAFETGIDHMDAITRKTDLEKIVKNLHEKNLCPNIKCVPMNYRGTNTDEIAKWLKHFCENGGEGIMLNISNAPYECKRTKNLLKVKQFNTADVLVMDVEEGTGANRGKLGAVVIKFIYKEKEYLCRVGSGFKLSEREQFWQNPDLIRGKIIEIGYFELSRNQRDDGVSMRFPTFKHLRSDKTEISMH